MRCVMVLSTAELAGCHLQPCDFIVQLLLLRLPSCLLGGSPRIIRLQQHMTVQHPGDDMGRQGLRLALCQY